MQLIDRIGIDMGIKHSVEDGLRWAATHGLHYQTMAEDHARKSVGECHPYREFEGMQSSI